MTGTRYAFHDAYGFMLDRGSKVRDNIVPGYPNMGCIVEDAEGRREPLFRWKYCIGAEDKDQPVEYKGKKYFPVRASLDEMRKSMDPVLWAAQMENNPIIGGMATFDPNDFDNIVPCEGHELHNFLAENGSLIDPSEPDRGSLDIVIPGDPAYSDRTHNDFSVEAAVAQDRFDYWYVMEARSTRDGWKGLEEYLKQAYRWKKRYNARELAIEAHAKEALKSLARKIERELGIQARWNPLKENAGGRNGDPKVTRIATALEDLIRGGRLWFCIPDGAGPTHPVERFRQMLKTEAQQFPSGVHDDHLDCLANCRQSFRMRTGEKGNKRIDMFPGRNRLPRAVRRWCVA